MNKVSVFPNSQTYTPIRKKIFFLYLGFLSRPFTNCRSVWEGGGHFFNSSLPLPPSSQTLKSQLTQVSIHKHDPRKHIHRKARPIISRLR